ncbi:hypothetical protein [Streptomyces aidingensis]|uniref:hypothetical protein n=1 Tax=Streptomyces aidingensis TaxID=910347 RepID=UPI00111497E8|nr:hypothetical protein [Streptomyces aidingensis]
MIPYTDDESVELVRSTVLTLTETMYASRKAALDIASTLRVQPTIEFGDPEFEAPSVLDLTEETAGTVPQSGVKASIIRITFASTSETVEAAPGSAHRQSFAARP